MEYGVSGVVREKQKAFRGTYILSNVIGICLCVLSAIPILAGSFLQNDFYTMVLLCVTFVIAGIGVFLLILNGVRWASMQKLLKQGEYTLKEKEKSSIKETVGFIYWPVLTAIYLIWNFTANAWEISWIVFAVGGILFGALMAICDHFIGREKK